MQPLSLAISTGHVTACRYDAERPRSTFILAHGAGAGQAHPFMVRIATSLASQGIDVFTFNFPYADRGKSAPDQAPVLEACYLDVIRDVQARAEGRPLFIGGKSMGGRIATQIAARETTTGISGIVVLGYPLHPPGKPDVLRVKHLDAIRAPILIVQGTRDAFGSPTELEPYFAPHGPRAKILAIDRGDHSLAVPKTKTGRSQADVYREIDDTIVAWMDSVAQRR